MKRSKFPLLFTFGLIGFACLIIFLSPKELVAQPNAPEQQAADTKEAAHAELFKLFISHPPVMEELVYRKKLPPEHGRPVPLETGFQGSTNFQHGLIRWSPDVLLHRVFSSPEELNSFELSNRLHIARQGHIWTFGPGHYIHGELNLSGANRSDAPFLVHNAEARHAGEVLNMGVLHLTPGKIRWQEDTFQLPGEHPLAELQISGTLHRSRDGRAESVTVEYKHSDGIATHSIRYDYANEVTDYPPYLPKEIHIFLLRNGRQIDLGHITIERLRMSSGPLPAGLADPAPFIAANQSQMRLWTNGAFHAVDPNGVWVPLRQAMARAEIMEGRNNYITSAFYLSVTLITVICAGLGVRAWKTKANP